ncbi:DedA family protein [Crocinitomicaceae bacterium]|jgi:membrane-associated protein|nr:DedA family protein [Flavobacteriales bacterium]MDC0459988.1 DedA family protein [Crocinitomicaceae bacterium]
MDIINQLIDFILHLDSYLFTMILEYGYWIYLILFLIVFVETGLVVMPLLPGDSLLFAAGTFCAGVVHDGQTAELNIFIVIPLLICAALIGDNLNYYIGRNIGLKVMQWKIKGRQIVKQSYIDKTQSFYDKHGPKTIILARYVPIVRTFAPFVAGVGKMNYYTFLKYSVLGGITWVFALTLLGFFFGSLPIVQNNFEIVIFGIIGLSLLPMVIEFIRAKMKRKNQ